MWQPHYQCMRQNWLMRFIAPIQWWMRHAHTHAQTHNQYIEFFFKIMFFFLKKILAILHFLLPLSLYKYFVSIVLLCRKCEMPMLCIWYPSRRYMHLMNYSVTLDYQWWTHDDVDEGRAPECGCIVDGIRSKQKTWVQPMIFTCWLCVVGAILGFILNACG